MRWRRPAVDHRGCHPDACAWWRGTARCHLGWTIYRRRVYPLFVFEIAELGRAATPYDTPAKVAFSNAVLGLDPTDVAFDVWSGDLRVDHLAERLTAASVEPGGARRRYTLSADTKLFLAFIDDFIDSLSWTTCDPERLREGLVDLDAYALAAHPVVPAVTRAIDRSLRLLNGYVGCIELDLGNPLHHQAARFLDHRYYFEGRTLKILHAYGPDDEATLLAVNSWARELGFAAVQCGERPTGAPLARLATLSERGLVSAEILANRDSWGHFDEIGLALARPNTAAAVGQAIHRPSEHPRVDERKLRDYCLTDDPDHAGYSKARLFRTVLGIERPDWRFLAAQLEDRLYEAVPRNIEVTAWGVKYQAQLPIVGRNGEVREVTTAWMIRGTDPPELVDPPALVTAFLPREDAPSLPQAEYTAPLILHPGELDNFPRLHEVANDAALTSFLVRPGHRAAAVELLGDSDFLAWLEGARAGSDPAPWIGATGRPATETRDTSFCTTYAKVLRQNGVPARTTYGI